MAKRHRVAGGTGSSCRNAGLKGIGKACVEALVGRVLLAVTAGEYDTIRSTYPGFNLSADMASINIIEITPDQLSVANLKSAITTAGGTTLPDLVVLRTTDAQNTITYASSADAVSIDISSWTKGAISIVGFGSRPLTIDAANKSRVISVGSSLSTTIVNLGGMTLTGGYISGGYGGGVYQDHGTLTLTNVTISGNTIGLYGGGVYQSDGTSTLTNVTISGNMAKSGGGLCQSYGTSTLINVTISGNTAAVYGGGVYQPSGTLASLALRNTIVARNAADSGPDVYISGSGGLNGSNNLIGDGSGQTSLVNGSNGNLVGSSASPIDPMLAEGTSFGIGLSPLPGSPAIDAGDNSLISIGISTDVYGAARIQGARVNIGAVETVLPGMACVTYMVTSLADSTAADGVITLREALAAANSNQAVGDAPAGSYSVGDVIQFAPGLSGAIRTNGQAYQISGSVSIMGLGISQLTLSGGGVSGVLDIRGAYDVDISGMTIAGGYAARAGGIYAVGSHLTLNRMVISGNTAIDANSGGGGVYMFSATLAMTNVGISGNTSYGNGGGVDQYYGTLTLTNVTISGNHGSLSGGGVYQLYGTSTLTNVMIIGNTTSTFSGGGVCQIYGTSTLTNVTISGNTAPSGSSGGVHLSSGASTLQNTIVARNTTGAGTGPDIYAIGSAVIVSGANNLIADGSGQTALVNGSNGNLVGTTASPIDPQFVNIAGTDWTKWDLHIPATSPAVNAGDNAWVPSGVTTDITGGARIIDGIVDMGAYEYSSENRAPSDIALSASTIAENRSVGTVVGTLSSTDPDASNTFTYSLVSGTGSTDNGSFTISGSSLKTAASFNYEVKSSYSIRVRTTDQGGLSSEKVFTISVTDVSEAPTNVALSSASVAENQPIGTVVGTLSTADPDAGNTFVYTLVSGTGSTNNASFTISGNQLLTGASFDFESKSSYSIRVRTTDQGGLWFEKAFTITVTNVNEAPTNIALSANSIAENQPTGTTVGTLSTTDPDSGNTFTYSLVSGTGSTDNSSFTISGSALKTAGPFDYESKSSYSIRVRSTDQGGLLFEKAFTISVTNVNEIPTDVALSNSSTAENQPSGTAVGTLGTTDPDAGDAFTYSLVSGTGSTDNGSFGISGNQVQTAASFDFEAKSSYSIRIRSTDQGGLWFEKAFTISVLDAAEIVPTITGISTDTGIGSSDGITSDQTLVINGTSEPAMTISIYQDGVFTAMVTADASGNWLFDYGIVSLADGSYSFTAAASDTLGHTTAASAPYAVKVDTSAPKVTAVYVRGSSWNTSFLSFLAANMSGSSSTYGYAIPVGSGAAQLQTLPWRNLNRISIAFSEDVSVAQAQFAIVGSVGSYSVSGFSYNATDHVATWSLSAVIGADKLYVALPGSGATPVTDTAGNALDGEWTNPTSYSQVGGTSIFPSGDGVAGGDFAFRFDVLPGDSTGGSLGKVNVADINQTKSRSALPETISSYRSDFDGNNLVNVADINYVKTRSAISSLPVNPPVLPSFGPVFSQVSLLALVRESARKLW